MVVKLSISLPAWVMDELYERKPIDVNRSEFITEMVIKGLMFSKDQEKAKIQNKDSGLQNAPYVYTQQAFTIY